jgi:HAD superfamily hydrolase (TIGR01509 family)
MSHRPKVIFFDVGNTLLFPNRDVILQPLREHAEEPTLQLWHAIERRTKKQFDAEMEGGHADHGFWYLFYTNLLRDMDIENDSLRDQLVSATRISANWGCIRRGTRESLDRMAAEYRIGVISNADGKISPLLQCNGICDCFLTVVDSGIVGYEKPHPAIFEAALRALDTRPDETLYVGDVHCVDYIGATKAGMQAVLFDVCGAYRDSGLPRVESLEGLERLLASRQA